MMRYSHPPAGWWRRLDHPILLALAGGAFHLVGVHVLGRLGNKLAFVAVRSRGSGQTDPYCQDDISLNREAMV